MFPTIKDIVSLPDFKEVKLIAGEGGLSNRVIDCGLLDFEYDPALYSKYYHSHFHDNQLAIASFVYAKDNPFLILDAVKYLVQKNVAGLFIKNVYKLPIPDSVIRYANLMNFPIFLISADTMYFEKIILMINNLVKFSESFENRNLVLHKLLQLPTSQTESIDRLSFEFNPYICDTFFSVSMATRTGVFEKDILVKITETFKEDYSYTISYYHKEIVLVYSATEFDYDKVIESTLSTMSPILENSNEKYFLGVSSNVLPPNSLLDAITESRLALQTALIKESPIEYYASIGSYKFILPLLKDGYLIKFSQGIYNQLREYDVENGTKLLETLLSLSRCDGTLKEASRILNQHENTLRSRFRKIKEITGLDFFFAPDYEQLSIASKISLAKEFPLLFNITKSP